MTAPRFVLSSSPGGSGPGIRCSALRDRTNPQGEGLSAWGFLSPKPRICGADWNQANQSWRLHPIWRLARRSVSCARLQIDRIDSAPAAQRVESIKRYVEDFRETNVPFPCIDPAYYSVVLSYRRWPCPVKCPVGRRPVLSGVALRSGGSSALALW